MFVNLRGSFDPAQVDISHSLLQQRKARARTGVGGPTRCVSAIVFPALHWSLFSQTNQRPTIDCLRLACSSTCSEMYLETGTRQYVKACEGHIVWEKVVRFEESIISEELEASWCGFWKRVF